MEVTLLDHMGSDLTVVNSARVSFDKWKTVFDEKDEKLVNYLAKHNHWSPFAHCQLQFRIEAPVFVARQLVKHQVGLSWNEVSRRYVDYEPAYYIPDAWRLRAQDKKQGSGNDLPTDHDLKAISTYSTAMDQANNSYKELLALGVCPEQARMVLPQSMMTKWIWSGSLYAFSRVCNLRIKPDAQLETRLLVQMINDLIVPLYPVSWAALWTALSS